MKRTIATFLTITCFFLVIWGCTPARKPIMPDNKLAPKTLPQVFPDPLERPIPDRLPAGPAELHRTAIRLAEAAESTRGVARAAAVFSNTTAYVGLKLDPGITPERSGEIKREAADRVRRADGRLARVYVTTDPESMAQIQKVVKGLEQGKTIEIFAPELAEIENRILGIRQ
ncbi:MAG: hypothetical protein CVU89_07005 [Firmicutes bacterium HGW-Firmicutes-14]|nr:MAG: hypothetical protein CVU89_07005 [Firmicutes bacterium HGW-Firmicutes-14]